MKVNIICTTGNIDWTAASQEAVDKLLKEINAGGPDPVIWMKFSNTTIYLMRAHIVRIDVVD